MITRVTESIYIGDVQDATDPKQLEEHDIDSVVTLASPEQETTTEYHPLRDGENAQAEFDAAVDAVCSYVEGGHSALVHCQMGRSRSPTIVATALAAERDILFDEALSILHETGRFISPHRALMDHARTYLDEPTYAKRADEHRK